MFLWTNRAVFPKWSQMHQRCQSLRVPQPWENHIYGNGKSIKHLSYCSPCSVVFMFKKWFCLLRMKKCKEYLAFFENDNIWVLDFEIRSLNIKKAVKSFSRGVFNFWMCLQPSIPVIAYLLPPLQFCNLPLISPQPSSSICWNCHCPPSIPTTTVDILSVPCFLSISGLKFLYFNVDGWFSFDLSSLMYYCLT